jgi:hypothetical protein
MRFVRPLCEVDGWPPVGRSPRSQIAFRLAVDTSYKGPLQLKGGRLVQQPSVAFVLFASVSQVERQTTGMDEARAR